MKTALITIGIATVYAFATTIPNNSGVKINLDEEELQNACVCYDARSIYNKYYHASDEGKDFIKRHEGLKLDAYQIKGEKYKTIGYGHYMNDGMIYESITLEEAEMLFEEDIMEAEESINRLLKPFECEFSQGFVDGMVSLVYNCGERGVKTSTFYKRLKKCRISNDEMLEKDLNYALSAVKTLRTTHKGHKRRRAQEFKMMIEKD